MTIGHSLTLFASAILILTACNKKSDNGPTDDKRVVGEWVTPSGTDYCRAEFKSSGTYSIEAASDTGEAEKGKYTTDANTGMISLIPEMAGTLARTWRYDFENNDLIQVTGKILFSDTQVRTVTMSRQSDEEMITVTVHSTADKSELTPQMLLGSSRIKLEGEINQGDFTVLRDCQSIRELNMKDVSVVGRITIYTKSPGEDETVDGNAIPKAAFGEVPDMQVTDKKANTTLMRITLPDKLEIIGAYAFNGCSIGGRMDIPSEVETILHKSFQNCRNLTGVTFPDELEYIYNGAFAFCTNLSGTVAFPSELEHGIIDADVFRGCENLRTVELPDIVTLIGPHAFDGCKRLISVNMPASLTSVWSHAFAGCSALSGSLAFPEGTKLIEDSAFSGTGYDGTLTINKGMQEIQGNAFAGTKFASVVLKWKGAEDKPDMQKSLTWFPEQFQTGKGTKTIRIPQGETEWYTANMPAPASGCFYNLKEY